MNGLISQVNDCPSSEIAAYLDGELDAAHAAEMEVHLTRCTTCRTELRSQRQFLCTLNAAMVDEPDFALPADFAKRIAANAESNVTGLRRPGERFNAIFICAALSLFVLFALGIDSGSVQDRFLGFTERAAVFLGFIWHLVWSVIAGISVVIRSISGQMQIPAAFSVVAIAIFAVIFVILSRKLFGFRRT